MIPPAETPSIPAGISEAVDGVRQETIYIGDTLYDEQCAHAAGVDFALAAWGAHSREGIRADHHLESPGEVLKLVVDDL